MYLGNRVQSEICSPASHKASFRLVQVGELTEVNPVLNIISVKSWIRRNVGGMPQLLNIWDVQYFGQDVQTGQAPWQTWFWESRPQSRELTHPVSLCIPFKHKIYLRQITSTTLGNTLFQNFVRCSILWYSLVIRNISKRTDIVAYRCG